MNIVSIVAKTNTGELFDVPVSDLSKYTGTLSIGDGYLPKMSAGKFIASSVIEDKNGQLFFKNYKNDKSYIGTPVALLGYDINGGIVPVPLINKPQPSSVATTSQSFVFNGTPLTIPIFSSDGSSLEDSDFKKFANGNYSLGGTNPFFKFDVDSGSINISQQTSNDAFRINNKIVITVDQSNDEITIGNIIYHTTNIQHIKTDSVQFNTSATGVTGGVGVLTWNDTDGTLEFGMKGGNVTQQIGQELPVLVKHADNSGLTNGSAVYIVGSDGNNKTVRLAKADLEATSSNTFGIMTESATGGNKAFCTTFGLVRDINTSSLTEGSAVYLSPSVAGGITSTKPTAPNHIVLIGFCVRSHSVNGSIFVNINNGYELDELHDVLIGTKVNKDLLSYESASGLWKNKTFADLGLATVDAFWSISGNNLATTGIIGSTSAQDVEFKANNQARFTMYAGAGLVMHSDATFEDIVTMESAVNMSALTASQILALDASKNIQSLSTVTYPNLTELSYVKGLTSTAQTQINSKEPTITAGTTSQYWRGDKSWQTLNKAAVGLGNVDNTTDLLKPISTATQSALDLKANIFGPTFTGTVTLPSTTSIGTVSSTEIGYLDGVTSSIQTQISGKFSTPIGLTTNYVTKWNGTALANSKFVDDGTTAYVKGNTLWIDNRGLSSDGYIRFANDSGSISVGMTGAVSNALLIYDRTNAQTAAQYTAGASGSWAFNTAGSQRLTINASGSVGIGTVSPDIGSTGNRVLTVSGLFTRARLQLQNTDGVSVGSVAGTVQFIGGTVTIADITATSITAVNSGFLSFSTNNAGSYSEKMRINPNGNVGIGTTNPSVKLDVNGQVSVSLGSASAPAYTFFGDLNNGWFSPSADTQAWSVGGSEAMRLNSAGSLGIGTTSLTGRSLSVSKDITGAVTSYAVLNNGTIKSDVTTSVRLFQTSLNTEAATFTIPTIYHYLALQNSIGAGSTVTSQNGFYVDASLVGATNNYGFRGAIAAASGRWNNYHDGTAQNYLAGNTGIGSGRSVPITALDVNGQVSVSLGSASTPAYTFFGDLNNGWFSPSADTQAWSVGGSEAMRLNSAGSLGLGTTSLTGINLAIAKNITGSTVGYGIDINAVAQTDVTNTARLIRTLSNNAIGGSMTDMTHFYLGQGNLYSVTNQTGIWITSSLTGATNNYGIRNQVSSGTGRWGLFFDGTVQNHIRGNVGIGSGSTVPATELEVRGVISASLGSTSSPTYTFVGDTNNGWYSPAADTQGWILNASEVMRLNSTGLGIGVTPAYKLDVNGTGHFTGAVTFDTVPSSLVDATTSNHLVRYSQWIASTSVKYLPMAVSTVALTNVTLSGTQTVNGVALIANDRILVTGQTTTTDNGVWVVAAGSWTRATDSDIDSEIRGFIVSISGGTYAGYKYINTNASAITIGTTPITYSEFSNVSEIDPVFVAWRDLSRTANTVLAAPNGSAGAASFRSLVTTDISNLSSYSSLSNYTTTSSLTTLLSGKSDIGHTHTFASLTSTPTTISGYGITILVSDVPTLNQNTTGSAATLTTTRNIATTGDLAWNVNFNGSADVTAVATLATVNSNIGTFNNLTVNAKGLVTSASLISYLTGNETITLSGDIVGSGTTAITTTLSATGVSAGTYQSITVDTKGRVTAGTNPTTLSGYGITDVYTKTESNARYVDLYNNQTNIAGQKTFTDLIYIRSLKISELESYSGEGFSGPIYVTTNGLTSTDKPLELFSSVTYFSNDSNMPHAVITDSGLKIGGLSDYSILPSERLDVDGNIIYTGLLMANSSAGVNGQFLGTNGSVDSWTTLTTNHISNLSSYSDFDNYFTETEITDFLDTKQNLLSGTGIVLSTAGTISYLTNNSTNWNSAYTFTNGFATNYPDLVAIEALAGTSGLLKKTAANTWALDSTSYLSTVNLTTNVTGILPIANGGTGSSLQNFVDLTTDQSISGIKTFNSQLNLGSILNLTQTLYSNFNNTSAGYRFNTTATGGNPYSFRINGTSKLFIHNNGVAIGYADNTSSSDRLDVNGTIKYVNLKADNSLGTSGQFLKSQGGSNPNAWSNIQMTDITGLSSALVSTLAGLTDVQLSSLGNKNILSYDTSLSKWKNSTPDSVDIIDKSTNQTITGLKIFTGGFRYLSPASQSIATSYNTWNSTDIPLLTSSIGGYGESINGLGMYFNKYIFKGGYLKLGGSYGIAGISSSVANPTERLDIDGNIKYSGLIKPSGVSGANKQVLSTNGTIDGWVTLDTSYISNLASYSGLENYTTTNDLTLILNDLIPTGTSGHFLTRDSEGELVFMDINIDPVTLSANKIAVGSPQGLLTEVDNFEFLSKRTLSISRAGYQDQKINIGHSLNSPHALIEVLGGRLELNSNVGIKINNLSGAGNRMLFVDATGNVGATAIPSGGSGGTVNYLPVNQIAFGSNTNEVTSTQNLTYEVASGQNRLKITNNSTNLFISTADNENSSISSNHSITISSTFKDVELLAGYYDAKVILSGNAVRLLTGAGGLWHNNTELEWVTTTINGQSREILLKKL